MGYTAVTVNTLGLLLLAVFVMKHLMSDVLMAPLTVVLKNAGVSGDYLNRLVEVLKREGPRVAKPVIGLRQVFPQEVLWKVTVVTRCRRVMTALHPGIKVGLHYVAVDARAGIGTKV